MRTFPGPPNYQFKPLTHQFDDGFGIIADAFNEAALRLERFSEQERFINSSLPIAYLYRHAIELYLKSIVIVLHRNLQIPFGPDPAIGALTLIGAPARSLRHLLRCGAAARSRGGTDRHHPLVEALDRWSEELIERTERREGELRLRLRGPARERVRLNLAAWEQGFHTPALALATMLHRSINIVHGSADVWSHPDEAKLLQVVLESAGNQPDLRLIPGAGHELAEAPDEVIAHVAEDLAGRLVQRPLPAVLLAIQEMG